MLPADNNAVHCTKMLQAEFKCKKPRPGAKCTEIWVSCACFRLLQPEAEQPTRSPTALNSNPPKVKRQKRRQGTLSPPLFMQDTGENTLSPLGYVHDRRLGALSQTAFFPSHEPVIAPWRPEKPGPMEKDSAFKFVSQTRSGNSDYEPETRRGTEESEAADRMRGIASEEAAHVDRKEKSRGMIRMDSGFKRARDRSDSHAIDIDRINRNDDDNDGEDHEEEDDDGETEED
eukprot:2461100-Rhodomonas_salina.1